MKILPKRDMIKNINYGTVVYTLNNIGRPDTDDPLLVINADYEEKDDCVFCASLNDGLLTPLDDTTIVEVADATLVINKY